MKKGFLNIFFTAGCVLTLLTGCGDAVGQMPSAADESSGDKQSVRYDTASETSDYITLADAKSVVLKNAGLSEDNVRFVRAYLDSERDIAAYDIEFICENAEYDYTVHAVTGEILSMNCETGSYDINTILPNDTQTAEIPPDTELSSDIVSQQDNNSAEWKTQQNGNASGQESSVNGSDTEEGYIGIEAAKQASLSHAGLKEADVNFVHAHLEWDDGYWKYDIEFHKDNTEYDYDIDALSGEILSYDHDAEYYQHGAAASPSTEKITENNAKEIALNHAGVAEKDTRHLEIEFDYDDGRAEYEIEWKIGRTEYSCDVDAYTGEILSFEKELD